MEQFQINIKSESSKVQIIFRLIGELYKNGQILNREDNLYYKNNSFIYYCITPEVNSLNKIYYNNYIKEIIKNNNEFSYTHLGSVIDSKEYCTCKIEDIVNFTLNTSFISIDSPLKCGKCKKPIALYKIPNWNKPNFEDILNWQQDYQACEKIYINSALDEEYFLRQISDIDSDLSKIGKNLCAYLKSIINKPIYYSLYLKDVNKSSETCPYCGSGWNKHKKYQCDNCEIVFE